MVAKMWVDDDGVALALPEREAIGAEE